MKYGSRRPVVLQVREPSMGMIQLGKISQVYPECRWGYLNNISAEMRKTGEYAVAPCVISLMQAWMVNTVYYFDKESGLRYFVGIDRILEQGHLKASSYRPAYWHLRVALWNCKTGQKSSKFTNDTLTLEWEQPEMAIQPAQLAFSL